MKPFTIDMNSMKAEIDLTVNRIFIVRNGVVECEEAPRTGFGEHSIKWQNGIVNSVSETSKKIY